MCWMAGDQVWLRGWLVRHLLAPGTRHRLALQALLRPHHHRLGQRDAHGLVPQAREGGRCHLIEAPRGPGLTALVSD